tara:strand:- start:17769 stop:17936 length:168 start_codon:yes stop_codon:yes gene_type:complete
MIVTSSAPFGSTSSIKEEEAPSRTIAMIALLFLDGRGAPDLFRGGAGGDDEPNLS